MQTMERLLARLLAVEIGGHGLVIEFDRRVDQQGAIFLGLLEQFGGNFLVMIFSAKTLVFPNDRLHADEVDNALEVAFGTDRQLRADRTTADSAYFLHAAEEIGANLVHLVDEHDARHVILVGLTPNGLRCGSTP